MYIGVNIEETQINKIKIGQNVDVVIDAYKEKIFQGKITEINNTTQTYFSGCTADNQGLVSVAVVKTKTEVSAADTIYTAAVEAEDKMQIFPNIGGKVVAINVELGQKVEKNALLFQIDSSDYILQLKQAQASYTAAQANYEKTAGGAAEQTELQLEQAVEKAQNELNDAEIAYNTAKSANYLKGQLLQRKTRILYMLPKTERQ